MSSDSTPAAATFRLSPQQAFVLAHEPPGAVSQCLVELAEPVPAEVLRSRLAGLVAEHEALRTTFVTPTGARAPVAQTVHDQLEFGWDTLRSDESALDDTAAIVCQEASRLDVERGPAVRALLIERATGPSALVLTAIAAAADNLSLLRVADALVSAPAAADAEPIQPADYAEWRHELAGGEDADAARARRVWAEATDGVRRESLLFGSAEAGAARCTQVAVIALSDQVRAQLAARAAEAGVSRAIIVEAAWVAVLHRVTGDAEMLVAELLEDRMQPELEDAIGAYAQIVPIRTAIDPETRFAELVDRLARARTEAARWRELAFDADLARVSGAATAGFDAGVGGRPPGVVFVSSGATGCPLELRVRDEATLELRSDPAAYPERDTEDLAGQLEALLAAAVEDFAQPVDALPLLDGTERQAVLTLGTGEPPAAGLACVHRAFERQALETPDLVALADGGSSLTFAELNREANRLAWHLLELGLEPGRPVGLCLPRSAATVTALLAIMKAGGGYLPLNVSHPPARAVHQLSEAGAQVVITESAWADRMPSSTVVCLDRDAEAVAARPEGNPDVAVGPDALAYVMYTSGSTGLPKGVAISHGNLAAYTDAMVRRLGAEPGLQFALVSEISTDLGNTVVFPPLVSGGTLHVIDNEASMDGTALAGYASRHAIDVMKITPTQVRALLAADGGFLPRRWLVLGGEALSWELADQLSAGRPGMRLLNHYGPTETTVGACTFDVLAGDRGLGAATVPIGRPLPGARLYIVDGRLEPVPVGVAGELCIGGSGVARGYVNREEETAQRFMPDPQGGRMYRTGDRARFLRDGSVEFLGRLDHQVKIRGYRVEPGEIEAALLAHPAVRETAVVARDDDGVGDPRLVAYFVATPEPPLAELQAFLARSLPDYMIPSCWVPVSAFPLTPSGKIDRQALPDPDATRTGRVTEFVAPRDDLEREIAAIWAQLLDLEEVGVTDDFFALGGHSLLATQAIMRIRRLYGNIPLGALFSSPTVAALAGVIRERAAG